MKIGVFDSGLGGLMIAKALKTALPAYDYLYLGDTLHVPYGPRSGEAIYDLCEKAMRYLFAADCRLIIMACNTASACALRPLQQKFLVQHYPDRRILGVVVPTLEAALESGKAHLGLMATERTTDSGIYETELKKINPVITLHAQATPLLVPLMEQGGEKYLDTVLADYLAPLMAKNIDGLILGCTHYAALKERIRKITGSSITLYAQDDIVPPKLADYLARHPEHEKLLTRGGSFDIHVTDLNKHFEANVAMMMGAERPRLIKAAYSF